MVLANPHDSTGGRALFDPSKGGRARTDLFHPRCADEDCEQWRAIDALEGDRFLEGIDLPPKGVATHRHVDATECVLIVRAIQDSISQQNHSRAGTESRQTIGDPLSKRLEQIKVVGQLDDGRRLPARDDQPVELSKFAFTAHGDAFGPTGLKGGQVFTHIALKREHTDARLIRHEVTA